MCNTALQIVKILSRPVAIPFPQSNRCLARFEFKKINNERATNPAHLVVDKNTFFGYSSEYEASPRQVRVLADVRLLKILTWLGHREVGSAFHRENLHNSRWECAHSPHNLEMALQKRLALGRAHVWFYPGNFGWLTRFRWRVFFQI